MDENSTKRAADGTMVFAGEAWFDPIEAGIRDRVRGFIQELVERCALHQQRDPLMLKKPTV